MSGVGGDGRQRRRRRRHPRRREAAQQQTASQASCPTTPLSRPQTAAGQQAGRHRAGLRLADVSRPCQPRWVTRVDAADSNFRAAFADYLSAKPGADRLTPAARCTAAAATPAATGVAAAAADTEFRPRLPTN